MYHDHDRSTFAEGTPLPTTTAKPRPFDLQLKWELALALPHAGFGGIVGDILRVLIQLYDPDEGAAWPSEARIGFLIGKDERTVRYHWPKVEASGLFTKISGRQHQSNRYLPNWAMVDKLVPADRKAFTGMMRAYAAQKATGEVRKPRSDRKKTEASGTSFQSQRHDVPEASGTSYRQTGQNSFSDRKDLVIQTGENLPATSLMDLSHQPSLKEPQNEGCAAATPPDRPRGSDDLEKKPSGWDAPDWDDEYLLFKRRFPGNKMNDRYQPGFAGIRQRGFTLDDMLIGVDYDSKIANPDGAPRTIASFFSKYFGKSAKPEDVQHWRKALEEAKMKAAHVQAMRFAKPKAPKATIEAVTKRPAESPVKAEQPEPTGSSYFNTPSMRRAAMLSREHVEIDVPF